MADRDAQDEAARLAEEVRLVEINALSITEAFDSTEALRLLLERINFDNNAINRLIDFEGLSNAREFSRIRPKNLSDSLENVNKLFGAQARLASRIYFPHSRIIRLKAMSAYFRRCLSCNRIPDIRLLDMEQLSTYEDHLDIWTRKADSVLDIVSNNTIKFDPTNFIKFRQAIETLCSSIRGSRGMSIEYLLRTDNNNPGLPIEEPLPDVNSIEFMRENTTLKGTDFQYDNQSLYTILRHYLSSTPGWNVISKYANQNDGRKAYKSLRSHYEGASYFDLMKTKASSMMMKTFYRGDTLKFSWEKYVAIHLEAHRMFDNIKEPITDSMKILYIKGGIRPEAGLESSLEVAKGLPNVNTSFDLFVNHLTKSVTNKRSRAETLKISQPRNVSAASVAGRGRGRFHGRGGRLSGRFHRGGRGGRFGRGRGRGRGNSNYGGGAPDQSIPQSITVEGKTLYPRRVYHKQDYEQLSYTQKGELQRARRSINGMASDGNSTVDTRSIKSAITDSFRDLINDRNSSSNTDDTCNNHSSSDGNKDGSVVNQFKRRRTNPN